MLIFVLCIECFDFVVLDCFCDLVYQCFYIDVDVLVVYGGLFLLVVVWVCFVYDLGCWYIQGFGVWVLCCCEDDVVIGVCGFWQGCGWL